MHSSAENIDAALGTDDQLAFSVPSAAKALDLSVRQVWALVKTGEIESIKIRGSRRIPRPALVAYVEALREGAAA